MGVELMECKKGRKKEVVLSDEGRKVMSRRVSFLFAYLHTCMGAVIDQSRV